MAVKAKTTKTTTKRRSTTTKKAASTAVATKSQYTVEDVPSMLQTVQEQIDAIKKGMPEKVETTGSLSGFGPIKDIKTLTDLIMARAAIEARAAAFAQAAKEVVPAGFNAPTFKMDGHTPEQWYADIKRRGVEVAHESKLKKLEATKKKLSQFVSEEQRLSDTLAEIHNSFNEEIE